LWLDSQTVLTISKNLIKMKKVALYFAALTVFGVLALSACKQKAPETTEPEAAPVEEVVPAADTVAVDTVAVQ
jgi:hypothetical protein